MVRGPPDGSEYNTQNHNALSDLRVTADSRYASVSGLQITFKYPADERLDREVMVRDSDGNTANLTVQVLVHAPRPSPPVDRSADYMPPALALVCAAALVGASAAVYLRAGKRAGPRA